MIKVNIKLNYLGENLQDELYEFTKRLEDNVHSTDFLLFSELSFEEVDDED